MLLPIYLQTTSSIVAASKCSTIEKNTYWTYEIGKYLRIRELPKDKKQTQKIQVQAAHFTLIRDKLYRRSFEGSYLKCLSGPEAQYIVAKLYQGICGNHEGRRTLGHHIHTQGHYQPTIRKEIKSYVRRCSQCQKYVPIPHMPSEVLNPVMSP